MSPIRLAGMVLGRLIFLTAADVVALAAGNGGRHGTEEVPFLARPVGAVYLVLWTVWWAVTFLGRRSGVRSAEDRGQRWLVLLLGVVLVPTLVFLPPWEYAHLPGPIPRDGAVAWVGLALFAAGITMQAWAMWTLRGFFTVRLGLQPGHRLVTGGPYRFVRHPGYASYILSLTGIGLAMGSIGGLAVAATATLFIVSHLKVEETMLTAAFGDDYRRYAAGRARLFPGIY